MKITKQKTLRWIPTIVVSLAIAGGAVAKLAALPVLVEIYTRIGLIEYLQALGIAEILFIVLFFFSGTMKLALLLLTGYFGGAMAVELSHGQFFLAPGILLTLVWIAAYLRDASIFSVRLRNRKHQDAVLADGR